MAAKIKDKKALADKKVEAKQNNPPKPDPHVLVYGTATPYVALFDEGSMPVMNPLTNIPLGAYISRFNYKFDEENENQATLIFDTGNPDTVDIEAIQEGKTLYLQWGYIYPNGESKSSKVHAVEVKELGSTFNDQGTTLTLKCKDGTSSLREDVPYKSNGMDWYKMKNFLDDGLGQERGVIIEMFE